MDKNYFFIADVQRPHGIKGEIKIRVYSDDLKNILSLKTLYVQEHNELVPYSVLSAHLLGESVVLSLENVDTREKAEEFRNKKIYISRQDASPLNSDEYYISDLIGIEVYKDNGEYIGILEDILSSYTQEIYQIKAKEGLYLCAKIKGLVLDISLENKKIILDSDMFAALGVLQWYALEY